MVRAKYALPTFLFVSFFLVGASLVHSAVTPLDVLGIPYPRVLASWHVIAPTGCALLWLATVRWRPVLAGVTTVLLCDIVLLAGVADAQSRVARIPVTRWLTQDEKRGLDAVPIRIFQQLAERGAELLVAPENEGLVREEIVRFGLLRK